MENRIKHLFIYLMQANLSLKNKCTVSLFLVSIFLPPHYYSDASLCPFTCINYFMCYALIFILRQR